MVAGLAIAATGDEAALAAAAVAGVSIGTAAWGPISDAIALEQLGSASSDYGRIRRWTSAGWVIGALVGGGLYVELGPDAPPLAFAAASITVGVAAGGFRTRRQAGAGHGAPTPVRRAGGRLRDIPAALRASPALLPFLVGLFLVSFGGAGAGSFLPLQIIDEGGGPIMVALAAALPAVIEIPFFSASGNLTRRLGLRALFAIGAGGAALGYAVVAILPEPWIIAAVSSAGGAAYALRYAAIVLIIGACLPVAYRAVGLSAAWFVAGGIAPIIADPLAGAVYAGLGGTALFTVAALVIAAGTAVVVAALDRPEFRAAPLPGIPSAEEVDPGHEVGGTHPPAGLD
jgi:hypothetical protein